MISTEGSKNKSMLNDRYRAGRRAHIILTFALLLVSGFSLAIGPADVSIWLILKKLMLNELLTSLEYIIIFDIRLPRLLLGTCVGAALAISGAVMQGLFRNPLADPGLIGISAGAGLGAIIAIVLGGIIPGFIASILGNYLVVFFCIFRWLGNYTHFVFGGY
jgi:iron complex transport system permease protein